MLEVPGEEVVVNSGVVVGGGGLVVVVDGVLVVVETVVEDSVTTEVLDDVDEEEIVLVLLGELVEVDPELVVVSVGVTVEPLDPVLVEPEEVDWLVELEDVVLAEMEVVDWLAVGELLGTVLVLATVVLGEASSLVDDPVSESCSFVSLFDMLFIGDCTSQLTTLTLVFNLWQKLLLSSTRTHCFVYLTVLPSIYSKFKHPKFGAAPTILSSDFLPKISEFSVLHRVYSVS